MVIVQSTFYSFYTLKQALLYESYYKYFIYCESGEVIKEIPTYLLIIQALVPDPRTASSARGEPGSGSDCILLEP